MTFAHSWGWRQSLPYGRQEGYDWGVPSRQENEAHIRDLPDPEWVRLMQSFQESRNAQIQRDQNTRFGHEIVEIHQAHYDELLEKIIVLAARQN